MRSRLIVLPAPSFDQYPGLSQGSQYAVSVITRNLNVITEYTSSDLYTFSSGLTTLNTKRMIPHIIEANNVLIEKSTPTVP